MWSILMKSLKKHTKNQFFLKIQNWNFALYICITYLSSNHFKIPLWWLFMVQICKVITFTHPVITPERVGGKCNHYRFSFVIVIYPLWGQMWSLFKNYWNLLLWSNISYRNITVTYNRHILTIFSKKNHWIVQFS